MPVVRALWEETQGVTSLRADASKHIHNPEITISDTTTGVEMRTLGSTILPITTLFLIVDQLPTIPMIETLHLPVTLIVMPINRNVAIIENTNTRLVNGSIKRIRVVSTRSTLKQLLLEKSSRRAS